MESNEVVKMNQIIEEMIVAEADRMSNLDDDMNASMEKLCRRLIKTPHPRDPFKE